MHGYAWSFKLEARHMCLPIAALEFAAWVCSIIIFEPILRKLPGEPEGARVIVSEMDALSHTLVLQNDRARSPIMQYIHATACDLPQFLSLRRELWLQHVYGPGNVMSDPLSRGMTQVFRQLCRQMQVTPIFLDFPPEALRFLDECAAVQAQMLSKAHISDPHVMEPPPPPAEWPPSPPPSPSQVCCPRPGLQPIFLDLELGAPQKSARQDPPSPPNSPPPV